MNAEEQGLKMGQIIAKAWADDVFKQKLITDTAAVLTEAGIEVPTGVEVRAVENTDKVWHLVLPPKPNGKEMSDEQIQMLKTSSPDAFCICGQMLDWSGLYS
jgi:hypothetical protein